MNNKKRKIETSTSVSDLVNPKESKISTSTSTPNSVSDLIKSKKSKIKTSASVSDLIKSKKRKIETSASVSDLIKLRKRYLYPCHCIRCNGAEVDFRTQENHTEDESLWKSEDVRKNQEDTIVAKKQKNPSLLKM